METLFQGNKLSVFPRELFQNSLDSINKSIKRKNKHTKGRFKIRRIKLDLSLLPKKDMQETFEAGITFLENQNKYHYSQGEKNYQANDQFIAFAKESLRVIKSNSTEAIVLEDDGIGLTGESRFHKNKGTSLIINKNQTSKGDDNRGSYGIGKSTAYEASNLFSVYYLNSHKGNKLFLGHTKFWSHEIDGENYQPTIYTGKRKNYKLGATADWAPIEERDPLNKLRSFDCDGLSTIIPTSVLKSNKKWIDDLLYIFCESYGDLVKNSGYTVEIIDEIDKKNVVLDKFSIPKIALRLTNKLVALEENKSDVKLFLTKAICTDRPIKEKIITLKHGDYKGEVSIIVYHAQDSKLRSKKSFRFIREGMMIRDFEMPSSRTIRNSEYIGIIKFVGKNNSWSNLFVKFENPDHDSINMYKSGTPITWANFNRYFIAKINKCILDLIDEHILDSSSDYEVNFGLGSNVNEKSKIKLPESASRTPIFSFNKSDKNREKGISVNEGDELGSGSGKKGGNKDSKKSGGDNKGDSGPGVNEGKKAGRKTSSLVPFKSKLVSKNDIVHKYKILVDNFDYENVSKLFVSQYSTIKNPLLSFKITSLKINCKNLKSSDFTPHKRDEGLKYYTIENIPNEQQLNIDLEVKEPRNTMTSFKLSTFENY